MPTTRTSAPLRVALLGLSFACACAAPLAGVAATNEGSEQGHDAHAGHGAHSAHRNDADAPTRSVAPYVLPRVTLQRHDGRKTDLASDLDDGKPVFLNFIFTTCTAICPPMSQVFAQFQKKLGAERDKVHMVSVSIDPEQDTPARLDEYSKRYNAGPQWVFYTGSVESSIAVQKAFAAYRIDKMNHTPLTFVRPSPGRPWVRLDGFATSDELLEEYRAIAAAK